MSNPPIKLTRNQIAEFAPNQRVLRFIEMLEQKVTTDIPDDFAMAYLEAAGAMNAANQALAKLEERIKSLESLAPPVIQEQPRTDFVGLVPPVVIEQPPVDVIPPISDNRTPVIDYIDIDQNVTVADKAGRIRWNAVDDTADLITNGNTYQLGQEIAPRYKNQSGVDIPNGCPVMYDGAVGISGIVKIKKAIADGSFPSGHTLGITTEAIANGSDGKATWFGKIRGLNTTGAPYGEVWAAGDILYISPTTAGYLTKVRPSAPNLAINMAVVVNTHAVNGEIHVRPTWGQKLIDLDDVNGTPVTTTGQIPVWDNTAKYFDFTSNINDKAPQYNGVMDGTKWTVTYDPGTRIFTVVVAVGGAYVVVDGIQGFVAAGTYTTADHGDTTGTYYCVVNASYQVVGSSTFTFFGVAILAYCYYNATTKLGIGFNEKHPAAPGWPASMHRHFHQVDGAKLISGGTVSTYNLGGNADADMQVSIDETVFDDESLRNTCAALTGGNGVYTHWYRSGADAAGEWSWTTGANLPILEDTDNPRYNQLSGGNWTNTTVSDNNRWINVYLIATNSLLSAHRFIFIQGQTLHTTANAAASESFLNAISWGTLPFAENVPLAKITFRRATGTGNDFYITSVVSIRGTQASITSVTSPTVHNTLAGRSDAACHPAAAITYGLTTVDATLAALGTMSTQNANAVAITGGAIDGTTIGGTTAAAGKFTTLESTGNTTIGDATGDTLTITGNAVTTPNGLNFDSNTLVVDAANNRVLVGSNSSRSVGYAETARVQVEGTGYKDSAYSAILNSNNADAASIIFAKSRGTATGSNVIVSNNDYIGVLDFVGADGNTFVPSARIAASIDGTPGLGDMPGRLQFLTTPDASSSPIERLTIANNGDVGINETAPDYKLDVKGTFGFTPGSSVTPVDNGDVVFELTNNTTLTIRAKGSDGTVRSVALTLA